MKKQLSNNFQYFKVLPAHIIHLFSYLVPRQDDLWIFIGWRTSKEREIFTDNSKYMFLHVHHERKDIRAIWIGMDKKICDVLREKGYEAYSINSLKGTYYSLRASHTFISGFFLAKNWKFSGGTKLVQLWHGKSLKKTGVQSPYSQKRFNRILFPGLFAPLTHFIAMSDFFAKFVTEDFEVPPEKVLPTGIPKHDALIEQKAGYNIDIDEELDKTLDELRAKKPNRIFFYGPTYRPDGSNPLLKVDLIQLNNQLVTTSDYVVVSLHPKFSTKDWIPDDVELSNIRFSQGDRDKYPIMHKFDALITDYSSLAIDFLYLRKPVILFAYDLEQYQKEMGVYDEIWNAMPGPNVFTFSDLLTVLKSDLSEYRTNIEESRKKIFTHTDANASKRITEIYKPI